MNSRIYVYMYVLVIVMCVYVCACVCVSVCRRELLVICTERRFCPGGETIKKTDEKEKLDRKNE